MNAIEMLRKMNVDLLDLYLYLDEHEEYAQREVVWGLYVKAMDALEILEREGQA